MPTNTYRSDGVPAKDLLTQREAYEEWDALQEVGIPCIAVRVPERAWGGAERGWDVTMLDEAALRRTGGRIQEYRRRDGLDNEGGSDDEHGHR